MENLTNSLAWQLSGPALPLRSSPQTQQKTSKRALATLHRRLGYDGTQDDSSSGEYQSSEEEISEQDVARWQLAGQQFQAWMEHANTTGCRVQQSTMTVQRLLHNEVILARFFLVQSFRTEGPPPKVRDDLLHLRLPVTNIYHRSQIKHQEYASALEFSEYTHYIGPGTIIAENAYRNERPGALQIYWSDVALAFYKNRHHIDTLRHVYMVHVENEETRLLVETYLYPMHQYPLPPRRSRGSTCFQIWNRGAPGYVLILGTPLGKSVASMVLGAWPRGTHRIARINTWFHNGDLMMRFDIERIPAASGFGH